MTEEKTKTFEEMAAENKRLREELEALKKPPRLIQTHDVRDFPAPPKRKPGRMLTTNKDLAGPLLQIHDMPDPEEARKKREEELRAKILADVKAKRKEGAK